ncbi:MAG TPA: flagellar basal body-associated FliL family protein [Myxococcaceae bacterium]|nr:flagellar basal body-associated FliL family protein [Myxococcaceae bacterium]
MSDAVEDIPLTVPKSKTPLLLAVNSLLLAGLLVAFFLRGSGSHAPEPATPANGAAAESAVGSGPTVRLGDFTVRLRNPEADRYVRVAFELEVPSEKEKVELANRGPQTRDAVISYLSDRTVDDMRGGEALERIKKELLRRLNEVVPAARIRALYVTEFVVQ